MTQRRPTEMELHAYLDGELDAARHAEVARALRDDPDLAAAVAAYAADGERLRRMSAAIGDIALDGAWIATIERGMRPATGLRPTRRQALGGGLAAAAAACAAVYLWPADSDILVRAERARALGGAEDGTAAGPQRDALLQAETGLRIRAPILDRFGFSPTALRLFGDAGHGAAQISYRDRQRRLLTIFVRPSDGHVRFDLLHRGALRVCVWQDEVVGTVIMAPMRAGEMLRIASIAYADLDL